MLDVQAAIQALSSPVIRSRTVLEFRQRLNLLEEAKPSFHWVPAHISVEGNEKQMSLQGRSHQPPSGTRTFLRPWICILQGENQE